MKKVKYYGILGALLLGLTACGDVQRIANERPSQIVVKENDSEWQSQKEEQEREVLSMEPQQNKDNTNTWINKFQKREWSLGNSQGNLLAQGYICEHQGMVYYRDLNHEQYLCVMNADGTGKQLLLEEKLRAIQIMGDYLYYIDDDDTRDSFNRMKRVKLSGGAPEILGENMVGSMLVTEDEIYYTGSDYIAKMNLDGTGDEQIYQEENGDFGWLGIYGDCIITGGVLNGVKITAVKIDGSDIFELVQGGMFPLVHGDDLYYSGKKGSMTSISLLTGEQKIYKDAYGQRSIWDEEKLYFTNGRQLLVTDTNADSSQLLYPLDGDSSVELYGMANHCVFFTEMEKAGEEEAKLVFKWINPNNGAVSVVP